MPIDTDQANSGLDPLETRSADNDREIDQPDDLEQPEEGPSLSGAGAIPSGSTMNHWKTASPDADATNSDSMPHTKSTPMPGETAIRTSV